jgi:hypothetical protein
MNDLIPPPEIPILTPTFIGHNGTEITIKYKCEPASHSIRLQQLIEAWFDDPNVSFGVGWVKCSDRMPPELTEVFCYIPGIDGMLPGRDWQDSDFCLGQHINGIWKRMDNENINVLAWLEIPEPPNDT